MENQPPETEEEFEQSNSYALSVSEESSEQREREQYAKDKLEYGKRSFRIPERIAMILGRGNAAGYDDYIAGKPSDPRTEDAVFIEGYVSGYRLASKGRMPQCVQLRQQGITT